MTQLSQIFQNCYKTLVDCRKGWTAPFLADKNPKIGLDLVSALSGIALKFCRGKLGQSIGYGFWHQNVLEK